MMVFSYQQDGHEIGPLTAGEFLARLKGHVIADGALVRSEEEMAWRPLDEALRAELVAKLEKLRLTQGKQREAERVAERSARDEQILRVAFSNLSLSKLPAEFSTQGLRGLAYARFLQEAFPEDQPRGTCTVFSGVPVDERAVFHWTGKFENGEQTANALKNLLTHFVLGRLSVFFRRDDEPDVITFETAHDFSRQAARAQRLAWQWARLLWWSAALTGSGAVFAGFYALTFGVMAADSFYSEPVRGHYQDLSLIGLASLFGLVGVTLGLLHWAKNLRLPPALRTLEKWPFRLVRITWKELR